VLLFPTVSSSPRPGTNSGARHGVLGPYGRVHHRLPGLPPFAWRTRPSTICSSRSGPRHREPCRRRSVRPCLLGLVPGGLLRAATLLHGTTRGIRGGILGRVRSTFGHLLGVVTPAHGAVRHVRRRVLDLVRLVLCRAHCAPGLSSPEKMQCSK
jgi:hypothetical protein